MIKKEIDVHCPIGLQVKQAGQMCDTALKYRCHITFEYDGGSGNAKSMLSILGAVIKDQDRIQLTCDGEDEEEAMQDLTALLTSGLVI